MIEIPNPGDSLVANPLRNMIIPFHEIYMLDEEIKSGAFGTVYKAFHRNNPEKTVAVKVMDRYNWDEHDETLYEVSMLKDLRNTPNIIQLIDFYMDDENFYIVQELAGGGDVSDRLKMKGTYAEQDARQLVQKLLLAVHNLHSRGIVHRDLKLENILLENTDDDAKILLCDFGEAEVLPRDGGLTRFVGTPENLAPEIIHGKEYREEVDMWSVGCLLFKLLSGKAPFGDEQLDPQQLYEQSTKGEFDFKDESWSIVSDNAKRLISNLLTVDPQKRWTASEALQCNWFKEPKTSSQILPSANPSTSPSSAESSQVLPSASPSPSTSPSLVNSSSSADFTIPHGTNGSLNESTKIAIPRPTPIGSSSETFKVKEELSYSFEIKSASFTTSASPDVSLDDRNNVVSPAVGSAPEKTICEQSNMKTVEKNCPMPTNRMRRLNDFLEYQKENANKTRNIPRTRPSSNERFRRIRKFWENGARH